MSDFWKNCNIETLKNTQCNRLLRHFRSGKSMTAREADSYPFFITQFHTRKLELEERGFVFVWKWEKNFDTGTSYKRYWLAGKRRNAMRPHNERNATA